MFVICSNSDVENQASKPAMIIGITGGIASGKSTVCKYLNEKYGVIHFDADKEIHALYEPGTEGYKQVVKSFGSEILNDDKSINRKILGEKVFGKPESMEVLRTAIGDIPTHFKNLLVNKYRKYPEGKVVIFEAVNLFESDYMRYIDAGWLVVTKSDSAIKRLANRNQLSVSDAKIRLGDARDWRKSEVNADYVFHNNSTLDAFFSSVDIVFTKTLQAYQDGTVSIPQWVESHSA